MPRPCRQPDGLADLAKASETALDDFLMLLDNLSDITGVAVDELVDLLVCIETPSAAP